MQQKTAVQALSALAQEHRLSVFRLLVRAWPGGMAAGEVAREVGLAPAALSFHLRELDRAGLVTATRDGRFIRYAVAFDTMRALLLFLTDDCCQGMTDDCGVGGIKAPIAGGACTGAARVSATITRPATSKSAAGSCKKSASKSSSKTSNNAAAARRKQPGELVDD